MIRSATPADIENIGKILWSVRQQLKAQQIATRLSGFKTLDMLVADISMHPEQWLVCETNESGVLGFFSLSPLGSDETYKRWRFPERAVRIEHFPYLLKGELLLSHLRLLTEHLPQASFLMCFHSSLRDAYWASLKAGFTLLGESSSVFGNVVWLYMDRENRFDEIQTKMRRTGIL